MYVPSLCQVRAETSAANGTFSQAYFVAFWFEHEVTAGIPFFLQATEELQRQKMVELQAVQDFDSTIAEEDAKFCRWRWEKCHSEIWNYRSCSVDEVITCSLSRSLFRTRGLVLMAG